MISEDSASPFFAFPCGLAAVVLAHHPSRLKRWNVGRPRKPGAASWVCFLTVFTSPAILEGVVFSGVNLMALDGAVSFFSVLAGHMDADMLEIWLKRAALEAGRTNIRAAIYSLTEEYQAFEDMKIQLEKERLDEYEAHGITRMGDSWYFRDELVRVFLDLRQSSSIQVLDVDSHGVVDVKVDRSADGSIRMVSRMTRSEAETLLEDWDDDEDGWNDSVAETVGNAVNICHDRLEDGAMVYLGEYHLDYGDHIWYDVSAKTGNGLQVGFVKAGDEENPGTFYFSASNRRTDGTLRCTDDIEFTSSSPVKPGTYRLFLRATDGDLGGVSGTFSLSSEHVGGSPVNLRREELPEAVRKAMKNCEIREWYVVLYGGQRYIYYEGFSWSFGWQPERSREGWTVDIVKWQKNDFGYVLLSVPKDGTLTVRVEGKPVTYTELTAE